MKTALFTICFSLALVAPTPTLSYSYNRHPITTSDDNTTGIQQQQQQQQHVLTFPSLPITISDDTTTGIQQQQQQQHVPTLPSLPITTKAPSSMTFGGQVVEYVAEQQKQTVHKYLNDLMQTLKTYGAPEVVQEAAEETVEHIQENLEDVQETAEEIAEEVQETAEETLEHIHETLENVNKTGQEISEEVHDHIQEIGSERAEYIKETVENVRETAEEQVERVQEALENIQETVEERVEEIQESMANATEATEEQAEEAQEAIEDVREYAQETVEEHVEQVQEILENVQDTAEEQHEQAVEALGEVGEYMQEASEQQMEQAQETLEQVKEYAQEAYEQLLEAIKGKTTAGSSEEVEDDTSDSSSEEDNDGGIAYTNAPVAITTTDSSDEVADNDGYAVSTFAPYATNSDNDNEGSNEVTTGTTVVVTTTDDDVSQEVNDNDDSDEVTTDADNSDDNDVTTTAATYDRTLIPEDSSEEADSADSDATSDDSDDVDSDEVTITTAAPAVHTTVLSVEDSAEDDDDVSTTITTAAPVSTTVVPNLCDGCDFKHGVGYNPHPSDCTLFVQCRLSQKGYPVVAGVKSCAHGLYWNQQKLTCDYRRNVKCVDDVCVGQKKTKRSGATCRGYWDCRSGTVTAKCCARGFAYNPVTARCHYQPDCQDDCLATSTQVSLECGQGMRGVQGDSTVYEVKTGPSTWTRMPCPATLAFSTNPCGCNVPRTKQQLNREPVCTPELYLPFHSDAKDFSGRNVYVKNDGVLVKGGKAFFDGHSRLTVNRFSNAWWGATVYVHLRFKSLSGSRQALVSNGDCQVRPSLAVCAGPGGVDFYAETQNSPVPANFTVPYGYTQGSGWQDVLYKLDGNQLSGFVNTHSSQASTKGNLESRQRGLVIGSGGGCEDFEGFMDEVTVYLCRPDYK